MQPEAAITIIGMAIVTYLTRVSGLWLMRWVTPSPRVEQWLRYLPGCILVALVAPTVFSQGLAEAIASLFTVIVAITTRQVLLAMLTGVLAVWLMRLVLS
jgi:uncharacterized membrane protein